MQFTGHAPKLCHNILTSRKILLEYHQDLPFKKDAGPAYCAMHDRGGNDMRGSLAGLLGEIPGRQFLDFLTVIDIQKAQLSEDGLVFDYGSSGGA